MITAAAIMPKTAADSIESNVERIHQITAQEGRDLLAQRVKEFLDNNLDRHITIKELSVMFHASQTQLKCSFKDAYGVSVYSYSRAKKMKDAACMLKESSFTVLEIAGRYGYNNGSKFARAFRDVMGMSPRQYRQNAQEK